MQTRRNKRRAALSRPRPDSLQSRAMFAHITPLEAPIVWFAFAAGLALGAFATWYLMTKRAANRA